MEGAPRQGLGSFFRALMEFVDERGLREQVRAGVSAATRATIDDPPRVLSFIPSTAIDDIESVLQKLVGDEGLAECGVACARPLGPGAAFHVLRGTLLFAYELSGTVGEVGIPQVVESTPAGVTVRYDVRWH